MPAGPHRKLILFGGRRRPFDLTSVFGTANTKLYVNSLGISGVGDGSKFTQWSDLSGNNNHLLQATGSKQFTYIARGFGNLPIARSTALTTYMQTSFTLSQPFVVLIIYKATSVGAANTRDIVFDGMAGIATSMMYTDTGPHTGIYVAPTPVVTSAILNNNVFGISTGIYATTSSVLRNNGTVVASGTLTTSSPNGISLGAIVGGTRGIAMDIAAFAVISGSPSTALIQQAERGLGQQFGISVA